VTVCTQESINIFDIVQSLVHKKGAIKRIQVQNVKNLVDINPLGKQENSFIAYSGLNSSLQGIVKLLNVQSMEEFEVKAHVS
jgi:hypothetical protein